jgi:hypothetical protein
MTYTKSESQQQRLISESFQTESSVVRLSGVSSDQRSFRWQIQ